MLHTKSNQFYQLGERLGGGGQGEVFRVSDHPEFAAKRYFLHDLQGKEEKVGEMIRFYPVELRKFAAMPLELLYDEQNKFVGFLMDFADGAPFHEFAAKSRHEKFPNARWNFFVRVAKNIAKTVDALHQTGFTVGDLNESNVFILKDATVKFIDCDSFQFQSPDGRKFPCEVRKPEYTAPELQDASNPIWRVENHDYFGLSVLIFQTLFINRHPFTGIATTNLNADYREIIKNRRFAHGSDSQSRGFLPPPSIIKLEEVSAPIEKHFRNAFLTENARPTTQDWIAALNHLEQNLKTCDENNGHFYPNSISKCPWCRIEEESNFQDIHFDPLSFDTTFNSDVFWQEVCGLQLKPNAPQKIIIAFEQILQEIEKKKDEYDNLGLFRATRLEQLSNQAKERQELAFLKTFPLADATISQIGYSRKLTLKSFGIETAADVTRQKIYSVPGFGSVYASKLLDWKKEKLNRFVFNQNQAITAADQHQIALEVNRRRIGLERDLKKGRLRLEAAIAEAVLADKKNQASTVNKNPSASKVSPKAAITLNSYFNNQEWQNSIFVSYKSAPNAKQLVFSVFAVLLAVAYIAQFFTTLNNDSQKINTTIDAAKSFNNLTAAINTNKIMLETAPTSLANVLTNNAVTPIAEESEAVKNFGKGVYWTRRNEFEKAVEFYEKAVALNPNYAQAHHELGYAFSRLGKFKDAVNAFNKAVELTPKHADSHKNLGSVYQSLNEIEKACDSFQKAKNLMPSNLQTAVLLNKCFVKQGKHEQALKSYRETISKHRNNAQLRYELGELYLKLGRSEDALDEYSELLKLDVPLAEKLAQEIGINQ